jgi:hypothetical protein
MKYPYGFFICSQKGETTMTATEFGEKLRQSFRRPFYFRNDDEIRQITGLSGRSLANLNCTGRGPKPVFIGKLAAYPTESLICFAVQRFSSGIPS